MEKGYIHIYTGNGKGKTTAAFGLALRAIGAGKKVYIGQFVKSMKYNETKTVKYLPNLQIEQFGRDCFINKDPEEKDIQLAKEGLEKCRDILSKGEFDIVVLDEISIAIFYKLLSVEEVLKVLDERSKNVEVIITGRYAPKEFIELADLVTEMKEIKHYYTDGVEARDGIER
ncbi:cob(I)yrinic acid a,c-diamide adenosyltransferase [Clostridium sp. D2Q-14]|uniref:cob(I)yrinic acid a,c-diamide adenosyltransferase n=1 Tax=Anaeromonas gelatinilytica TaxID=2683194 RepID=UPI00193C188F|nr:cob(I)yrinic acid a,c-diamide adenosyltransferase [Anaeromonas gelatinilytica]MBS4534901.1 cob(I)yrinic acid a,c-diamide adenosyltransferase [Anaeromonas gelatinilytica]